MSQKSKTKTVSFTLPEWKANAFRKLADAKALNFSKLIENLVSDYFGEALEEFKPKSTKKNPKNREMAEA